jgi:hypothetical protein
MREVKIPSGTSLSIALTTPLASDTSKEEDVVHGTLTKPLVIGGNTVLPQGAELSGTVLEAKESGRVKGKASITFQFDRLVAGAESHSIQTSKIRREAAQDKGDDLKKGGIGAAAGGIIGGIAGGGTGAAIGAAVGGTGAVLGTKGKEVSLPEGTTVTTVLQQSVTLIVQQK